MAIHPRGGYVLLVAVSGSGHSGREVNRLDPVIHMRQKYAQGAEVVLASEGLNEARRFASQLSVLGCLRPSSGIGKDPRPVVENLWSSRVNTPPTPRSPPFFCCVWCILGPCWSSLGAFQEAFWWGLRLGSERTRGLCGISRNRFEQNTRPDERRRGDDLCVILCLWCCARFPSSFSSEHFQMSLGRCEGLRKSREVAFFMQDSRGVL